jgi:hypothetical protein
MPTPKPGRLRSCPPWCVTDHPRGADDTQLFHQSDVVDGFVTQPDRRVTSVLLVVITRFGKPAGPTYGAGRVIQLQSFDSAADQGQGLALDAAEARHLAWIMTPMAPERLPQILRKAADVLEDWEDWEKENAVGIPVPR